MKKKFSVFLLIFLATTSASQAASGDTTVYSPPSATISPMYASPISTGQNKGGLTLNSSRATVNYSTQNIISDGKVTVYIGYANGLFYANGKLLGPTYQISNGDHLETLLNGLPLREYSFSQNLQNDNLNNKNNPIYISAYTKFLLEDYRGAVSDCDQLIKSNPNNSTATVIKTVSQAILDKKISSEEGQQKVEKLLKNVE